MKDTEIVAPATDYLEEEAKKIQKAGGFSDHTPLQVASGASLFGKHARIGVVSELIVEQLNFRDIHGEYRKLGKKRYFRVFKQSI